MSFIVQYESKSLSLAHSFPPFFMSPLLSLLTILPTTSFTHKAKSPLQILDLPWESKCLMVPMDNVSFYFIVWYLWFLLIVAYAEYHVWTWVAYLYLHVQDARAIPDVISCFVLCLQPLKASNNLIVLEIRSSIEAHLFVLSTSMWMKFCTLNLSICGVLCNLHDLVIRRWSFGGFRIM